MTTRKLFAGAELPFRFAGAPDGHIFDANNRMVGETRGTGANFDQDALGVVFALAPEMLLFLESLKNWRDDGEWCMCDYHLPGRINHTENCKTARSLLARAGWRPDAT